MGLWFLNAAKLFWNATHLDPAIATSTTTFPSENQIIIYLLAVLGTAILGFLLIGLMVMDWQTMMLPDAFTVTGIAIGLFLVCTQAIFLGPKRRSGSAHTNTACISPVPAASPIMAMSFLRVLRA
ncbi:MAG: hypothetical protein WDN23_10675 [Edaphobacter sp.]